MVDLSENRLKELIDLGEVDYPTQSSIEVAGDVNIDFERMAMESAARVVFCHFGKPVG